MVDENIGSKPYKLGDKLILEIEVTDEDKSFDFLGKTIMNKLDTSEFGFTVETVSFWKERYINNTPMQLRIEIEKELNTAMGNIDRLMNGYGGNYGI